MVCVYGVSCAWMRQSLLLNLKIINLVRLNDKWDSGICPSPIQQDVELQTWPILLGCLHGFGGSRFLHSHRGSKLSSLLRLTALKITNLFKISPSFLKVFVWVWPPISLWVQWKTNGLPAPALTRTDPGPRLQGEVCQTAVRREVFKTLWTLLIHYHLWELATSLPTSENM